MSTTTASSGRSASCNIPGARATTRPRGRSSPRATAAVGPRGGSGGASGQRCGHPGSGAGARRPHRAGQCARLGPAARGRRAAARQRAGRLRRLRSDAADRRRGGHRYAHRQPDAQPERRAGANWTRPLGPRTELELTALQRLNRNDFTADSASGADSSRFTIKSTGGESNARGDPQIPSERPLGVRGRRRDRVQFPRQRYRLRRQWRAGGLAQRAGAGQRDPRRGLCHRYVEAIGQADARGDVARRGVAHRAVGRDRSGALVSLSQAPRAADMAALDRHAIALPHRERGRTD